MEKKNKEKFTFREMIDSVDSPFREHLMLDLLKSILILIMGIVLSIVLRQLSLVFLSLLIFVLYAGITYYKILACTEGLVHVYEGECIGKRNGTQPSCVIKLNDGYFLEIYGNIKKSKVHKGDIVKAYIPYKSISAVINEASFKTYTCYGLYVIRKSYSEYTSVEPEVKNKFTFIKKR